MRIWSDMRGTSGSEFSMSVPSMINKNNMQLIQAYLQYGVGSWPAL